MTALSWRTRLAGLTPPPEFTAPASPDRVTEVEARLGVALPEELAELLAESDGLLGEYGLGLVWPSERILHDNLSFRANLDFRELYMPFDPLLFFGDAGNGNQFAFAINAGRIRRPDIFAWDHENDSRTWVAPSLERYLDWWLAGKIQL